MEKSSVKSSVKSSAKTSEAIVNMMTKNNCITADELAQSLHITKRAVEKAIKILKDAGYIVRVGSKKVGHWEVVQYPEK